MQSPSPTRSLFLEERVKILDVVGFMAAHLYADTLVLRRCIDVTKVAREAQLSNDTQRIHTANFLFTNL